MLTEQSETAGGKWRPESIHQSKASPCCTWQHLSLLSSFFFVAVINHYHLIRAYSSIGNSVPGLGSLFDSQIGFLSVSLARTRRETGKEKERMIWRDVYPIHTVWNGGEREREREKEREKRTSGIKKKMY